MWWCGVGGGEVIEVLGQRDGREDGCTDEWGGGWWGGGISLLYKKKIQSDQAYFVYSVYFLLQLK